MPRGDIPGWRQVLADDFTENALGSGWGAYEGPIPSMPGGVWRRSHVTVRDGKLRLLGHREGTDWVTGGVMNFAQAKTTYGRYEVRFRMDAGNGVKYAILTWPQSNVWPADGEIDFAEDGGGARTGTAATVHYARDGHQIIQRTAGGDFSVWHTVGVEWTPGRLVYTLDGVPWATVDTPFAPSKPMNLAIQTEAAKTCTQWMTCIDATTPAHVDLEVDWVAVYVRS
jgi:beta-glucanase (GH16 family)